MTEGRGPGPVAEGASRAQRGQARRAAIVRAAKALFAARGFDGVSIRDIAGAVGVNSATLYHHFPSKALLYQAVLADAYAERARRLSAICTGPGSREQRLWALVRQFCRDVAEDPEFLKLVKREQLAASPARLEALWKSLFAGETEAVQALLAEFPAPLDPVLTAYSLFGMIVHHFESTAFRHLDTAWCRAHDDPEVVARHVYAVLIGTLGRRTLPAVPG